MTPVVSYRDKAMSCSRRLDPTIVSFETVPRVSRARSPRTGDNLASGPRHRSSSVSGRPKPSGRCRETSRSSLVPRWWGLVVDRACPFLSGRSGPNRGSPKRFYEGGSASRPTLVESFAICYDPFGVVQTPFLSASTVILLKDVPVVRCTGVHLLPTQLKHSLRGSFFFWLS